MLVIFPSTEFIVKFSWLCDIWQISDDLDEEEEANKYSIEISVTDPKKIGDGMNAYMAYKVITKVKWDRYDLKCYFVICHLTLVPFGCRFFRS